jgi:hypothetical protein
MRLLWETAIRPFVPQCSSHCSSLPSGPEQVAVPFNDYPGLGEDARKLFSEIAVGEVNPTHAARE